jgi:hypothetical protein
MKHNHQTKAPLAVLLCGLLLCGQAFGITVAEDLDGQLEIRPSAPTASWPESGDSNELAPNYTATISVTVVESEEVGGVNYTLSSGPDATTGSSDTNVVWTESGTTFSITNTAADTASATMTLTCVWSPEGGSGGDGPGPEDIHGQADADVQLLDSVVDWDFDRTRQWADGEKDIEFTVTVTDDNGFGLERWELTEFSATESEPSDPAWAFYPVASDGPAWMMTSTALSDTPSKGKVKMTYDDGSEEERTSPEEIGFLMLEVEAPTQLTLLESWALQVKALPDESDIEDIDDLQLEVQRVGQTTWYEFDHGGEPEYTEPARVAGKFAVRVKGSIGDSEHETEPTEEIEVRFPAYADIIGDSGASSKFNQLWTTTKNDATDGQRREHGTWVLLNTDSEDYEFDDWPPGGWTANDAWASITPSPKPDDDPLDPTPLDKPTYLVAAFHTHPPATYQTDSSGNQAGLVQVVGPSTQDDIYHNHHKLPGIVYDYTATGTDGLGRPAIPYGHPKNSGAELYPSGSFDRRSLE